MAHPSREEQIEILRKRIEDLKKRFPSHSTKPEMYQKLEEMEEELARLLSSS
ncbi:MAG: histidine kinase [Candidatus Syntrophonatronum acetioxidans]|uniref:Histidine kinase n=1 Tax=Candidatus Syntrophonatronum acetioxidans TaxID=1795816 RepID=A0A424YEW6_9FIRM|nr:MAG: histidine kinase [Candidatus Syntrophonatronum acetioxidans]